MRRTGKYAVRKRITALFLAVLLCGSTAGRALAENIGGILGGLAQTEEQTEPISYPQLTAEDIVRLDGGDAELLYDEEGRVTFIRGRYSPEKVENYEDAVESLNYVATLLGLTKGALFFCVYAGIDRTTGYTYYLFLQRDGDVTVVNASIKIYVDPEGYTAALSCSFQPSTGIREETAGRISREEAQQIVISQYPDLKLRVYEDATTQAGVMEDERNIHVWSVFTNNPEMASGDSDLPYLQHFVSYRGEYLMNLPCSTISQPLLQKDDALERKAKAMFEGYEPQTWTGRVTLHDQSLAEITVPVARSLSDGRYYLMDLERKMLVADYKEATYGSGEYVISSSDTNSGWKDKELLAMYNIGRVYDYYADHGLYSVDGSGIPIAILSGVCEADGTPVDNAYFNGFRDGFGLFAISDVNDSVECLDIMGHEFTHGITSYSMGGSSYVNELGAINEAFSDIMGNLCELTYAINDLSISRGTTTGQFEITGTSEYGSSDDPDPAYPDWRIGEMGGRIYRDMSDPVAYRQPAFVRDAYYCLPTGHSNVVGNDYGGVHINSSLLGSIAWEMNERGLDYEKQYSLWMTAMNMMTPKSDYDDICQAMIFARKTYGWEEKVDAWIEEAFAKRGLLENARSQSRKWDGMTFEDYNREALAGNNGAAEGITGTDEVIAGAPGAMAEAREEITGIAGEITGAVEEIAGAAGEIAKAAGEIAGAAGEIAGAVEEIAGSTKENITDTETGAGNSERVTGFTEGITGGVTGVLNKKEDWLAGVSLDQDGRIAREGFGRIELDTALEDAQILVGVAIIEPYTYMTLNLNCPDENGHVSFLLPEGNYWLCLCVSHAGPAQTIYWPYTRTGTYEPYSPLTTFGTVEVKAGRCVVLPKGDVA